MTNMIDVEGGVWDNYVTAHSDVDSLRWKRFPYYKDWKIIFGNDRANGNVSQQINDAILQLQHRHAPDEVVYDEHILHGANGKGPALVDEFDLGKTVNLDSEESDDANSVNQTTSKKESTRQGCEEATLFKA